MHTVVCSVQPIFNSSFHLWASLDPILAYPLRCLVTINKLIAVSNGIFHTQAGLPNELTVPTMLLHHLEVCDRAYDRWLSLLKAFY